MTSSTAMQQHAAAGIPDSVVAMIPHVNVQAFCDDQNTARIMQAVAADRRMAKAHMDIQLGGIDAAAQVLGSGSTPNVLLVESTQPRQGIIAELEQLAAVCDPATKVIVIGHVNDVILYRELIRAGISEYLVAPLHQLQVIEAIGNLFHDSSANPVGRVAAFVGVKGGVGSSTIAHNVAWLISRQHAIDTVITDLDLAFGTAGLNFNLDSAQGIVDALSAPERVDQVLIDRLLTKCGDRLSLLAAPGSFDREVSIEAQALETVLRVVRGNVPMVVVDVPNVWAPWTRHVLVQADEVVITATPEIASLRNAKNFIDLLKTARPNDRPPRLVLNQMGVVKRPEIPLAEFSKAVGLEPALVIPYDAQSFGTAASNGQMLVEIASKSKAAEAFGKLAQLLVGREPPAKTSKFPFAPLMKKLRKK
ncbi:MAG: CpaE family protein [Parvibaculaceae bacterium]